MTDSIPIKIPFTIQAPPETDIWRKTITDVFNAPSRLTPTTPLFTFTRAQISFKSEWRLLYDQGGLLLHFTHPSKKQDKWLKTGIELYNNVPNLSSVGCDSYADWTLYPVGKEDQSFTVEVRREASVHGPGLWIYWVRSGERVPVRELAWVFADEEGWNVQVGAYAARPAAMGHVDGEDKRLRVEFWDFEVEFGESFK